MNPQLSLTHPTDSAAALAALAQDPGAALVGGGTELVPLMRAGLLQPQRLLSVRSLGLQGIERQQARLVLGAGVTLAAAARHPLVLATAPAVSQALLQSASPQVRNVATLGGNLLQHTRCPYYRQGQARCHRLAPGSGCATASGEQRHAALFGSGDEPCLATHPSDLAVALLGADAVLLLDTLAGPQRMGLDDFYQRPPGLPVLVRAIELPADGAASRAVYLKVRDRASLQFAVVSVAVSWTLHEGRVQQARVAAGGVAARPWRLPGSEQALQGHTPGTAGWARAVELAATAATQGARPLPGNQFKLALLQRLVTHAVGLVADMADLTNAGATA